MSDPIRSYTVTHNPTGKTWSAEFAASDMHSCIPRAAEALFNGEGLTHEQAARQIDIWNRAQSAHRQEFSYRLA